MSDEWVMVPRDPTEAMFSASSFQEWDTFEQEWRAMLDAAPAAPVQQAEPVAWMFDRRYGSGLSFGRPADYENEDGDTVSPTPLFKHPPASAPQGQAEPEYWIATDGGDMIAAFSRKEAWADFCDEVSPLEAFPVYRHPPAAEVQRLREALKPFAAIDLTTNQAVDAMDVLRARRALEGK